MNLQSKEAPRTATAGAVDPILVLPSCLSFSLFSSGGEMQGGVVEAGPEEIAGLGTLG